MHIASESVFLGGNGVLGFALEGPSEAGLGDVFDTLVDVVTAPVKAVASAGKAIYNTADDAADAIGDAVGSIPVLGDVSRIVSDAATAPLRLAHSIASGARLDRALMKAAKDQVRIAREAAPYAQTVLSVVPGIGTGVSAAIGAGVVLAEGKGIDEAAKAAIRSAIPGGPLAVAGYDAALKVAAGKNVGKAALESARELIPPGPGRQAFDVGLAVITGENIQTALVDGFVKMGRDQLGSMAGDWVKSVASKPEILRALTAIPKDTRPGYALAMSALGHEGINPQGLTALRGKLNKKAREGFDLALKKQKKKQPWLNNVLSPPPKEKAKTAPAAAKATPRLPQTPARTPPKLQSASLRPAAPAKAPPKLPTSAAAKTKKAQPKKPPVAVAPAATLTTGYAPYPSGVGVHGLGAISGGTKRYFFWYVYKNGQYATSVGPQQLSDYDAFLVEERTKISNFGAELYRFIWQPGMATWLYDARTTHELHAGIAPRTSGGVVSGPPRGHHGGGGRPAHMARPVMRPFARGGGFARWPGWWWDVPWQPQVVTQTETCQTWGDPIEMPPAMQTAAKIALNISKGKPTNVRGPDGVLYLFSVENGVKTARPCAAVATS